jgi:hypothetical protein
MRRDPELAERAAVLLALIALMLGVALFTAAAKGQDINNHESGHDIYKHWQRPGGGMNCCSGRDCGPWPEEDISPAKGGFYIHSHGTFVPMKHVLPSPDGQYHVCCSRSSPDEPCRTNEAGMAIVFCLAAPMGY